MRYFGSLLTAYLSGEFIELMSKKHSTYLLIFMLVFMITSIFPLMLAFVSLLYKEKKHTKADNPAERINASETMGDLLQFIAQPAIYK